MTEIGKTYVSTSKAEWEEVQELCTKHYGAIIEIISKMAETSTKGTFRVNTPYGYVIFKTGVL